MFTRACASAYRVAKTRRAIRARGVLVLVLVCVVFTIILNVSLNRARSVALNSTKVSTGPSEAKYGAFAAIAQRVENLPITRPREPSIDHTKISRDRDVRDAALLQ